MDSSHVETNNSNSKSQSHPIYEPLNKDEIRVLVLASGSPDDPLKGRLVHISRTFSNGEHSYAENFVALSYTWSDQTDPATIQLNEYTMPIGRNLALAIRRLRHEKQECTLWIDALCIDQKDDVEKSIQVQQMPIIYESAVATFIWLGVESEGTAEAFAWLRRLAALPATPILSHNDLNTLLSTVIAVSLANLLSLPWWRRAWIIQEATVCRVAIVMCGPYSISFDYFITLANLVNTFIYLGRIDQHDCPYGLLMPAAQDLLTLAELRNSWRQCGSGVNFMDLESILRRTYLRTLASDPRDRFYALLSMTKHEDWMALIPDYSLSRNEVFLKATLHLMRKKSSLDILQLGENLHCSGDDPSWLPGWDQEAYDLGARESIKGNASDGMRFSLSTNNNLRTISAPGFVIGDLEFVSCFQLEDDKFQPSSCILQWLDMLEELDFTSNDPYVDASGRLEAFARTLVAGEPMLVPDADDVDEFPLRNVFKAWTTMDTPNSNISPAWRKLQKGTVFDAFLTPASTYRRHALRCLHRRSFVVTTNGHMGLAPDDAKENDVVTVIGGSSTPVCLRRIAGGYRWVGAMYLHGVMHGQAVRNAEAGDESSIIELRIQ